jgi:type I restriction enzyme, S subunit
MSKKQKTIEKLLEEALVPEEEQPYEVPENWVWSNAGALSETIRGVSYKKNQAEALKDVNNCLILRGGNIQDGTILNQDDNVYVSKELVKEEQKLQKGDVVIVSSTGSSKVIGKAASVSDEFVGESFGAFLTTIRPNKKINSSYFGLFYQTSNYRRLISNLAKGSNINNIKKEHLDNLPFPLPPLNEQKRIAEKVERLFAKIDEAKQLIEEAKETFELRRAAILDKAFRGELTKKWREQQNHLPSPEQLFNVIKEQRLAIVESKKELNEVQSMFENFNFKQYQNERNWLYLKANMFCYNINCGSTPTAHISENGEIPFLKVYNIVNNKIDFEYKPQFIPREVHEGKLKKSILYPNDVIMNIVGPPLKKVAIIPDQYSEWNINQAIVRFRPVESVLPKYIYYCLQYDETLKDIINETRGVVGQSNISVSQCRNLVMPIPSREEQEQIVERLDNLLEKENKALASISIYEKELEKLKQSILSKAFCGELGTNDPTEESAIELLKEVLQEKVK